ncbi:MAG: DUF92 domain-containing protein [Myxococcota bacterium]
MSGLVLLTLIVAESSLRLLRVPFEVARKAFHLFAGTVTIIEVLRAPSANEVVVTALLFAVSLPVLIALGVFKVQERSRGYGTVTFALGVAVSTHLYFDRPEILISALAVLTYGDGLAALAGKALGRRPLRLGPSAKTVEGSLVFITVSAVCISTVLLLFDATPPLVAVGVGLVVGFLAGVVEAQCTSDIDNGAIPIFVAVVLEIVLSTDGLERLGVGALISAAFAGLAIWRSWVTVQAGVLVALIVMMLFAVGGLAWVAPVSLLLISASLVQRAVRGSFENPYSKREGPRDLKQIVAKGIPATVIAFVYAADPDPQWLIVHLAIVATATADTFASAIGSLDPAPQIPSLPWFRPVPKGMSGGISPLGTLAAVLSATVVASEMYFFVSTPSLSSMGVIAVCGVTGAMVDSLLGGTVQALYRCNVRGQLTESPRHLGQPCQLVRGIRWMDSAAVNLSSGVFAGLLAYLLRPGA